MPNNRKAYVHGGVYEICFRTEEGLPLVAKPYLKVILESILARAQERYQVEVNHFDVMGNHVHMIFTVLEPQNAYEFIGYFKRESAHAVNRLTGRPKHTVWIDGYDSPQILDSNKLIERIAYIYLNPARAGLVDSVEEYPNLSSWEAMKSGITTITRPFIRRDSIEQLPKKELSPKEEKELAEKLIAEGEGSYTFTVNPYSCFAALGCTNEVEQKQIVNSIITMVKKEERRIKRQRTKPVMGVEALRRQRITFSYTPKKRSKRSLCLSSLVTLRVQFIAWYRELVDSAPVIKRPSEFMKIREVPPGLFAPGGFLAASLLPWLVPTANTVLA